MGNIFVINPIFIPYTKLLTTDHAKNFYPGEHLNALMSRDNQEWVFLDIMLMPLPLSLFL